MDKYRIIAPFVVILLIFLLPILIFFFIWMILLALANVANFVYSREIMDIAYAAGYSIIAVFLLLGIFKLIRWLKD